MLVERGWIKSLNHVSLPCLANTPLFESFHRTRRKRKTSRREPPRLLSPACSGNEFLDVSRGVFRPPLLRVSAVLGVAVFGSLRCTTAVCATVHPAPPPP